MAQKKTNLPAGNQPTPTLQIVKNCFNEITKTLKWVQDHSVNPKAIRDAGAGIATANELMFHAENAFKTFLIPDSEVKEGLGGMKASTSEGFKRTGEGRKSKKLQSV